MLEIYKKPCCMISIRKAGMKSFALKAIQEGFRYIVAVKLLHSEDSFNGMIHRQVFSCCCDIGQIDIFSRIELITSIVLSSDNTNYKNDIQ